MLLARISQTPAIREVSSLPPCPRCLVWSAPDLPTPHPLRWLPLLVHAISLLLLGLHTPALSELCGAVSTTSLPAPIIDITENNSPDSSSSRATLPPRFCHHEAEDANSELRILPDTCAIPCGFSLSTFNMAFGLGFPAPGHPTSLASCLCYIVTLLSLRTPALSLLASCFSYQATGVKSRHYLA